MQACGTSLVETVNHVLDFTKLSGNTKTGGVENVIVPTTFVFFSLFFSTRGMRLTMFQFLSIFSVDLMQLVEEAVDGCWIGHRARTAITGDSGIGSVYSPPKEDESSALSMPRSQVETIVDIGHRPEVCILRFFSSLVKLHPGIVRCVDQLFFFGTRDGIYGAKRGARDVC